MEAEGLIELIESLPDSEYNIYTDKEGVTVTPEYLVCGLHGKYITGGDFNIERAFLDTMDYIESYVSVNKTMPDKKILLKIFKDKFLKPYGVQATVRNNEIHKETNSD